MTTTDKGIERLPSLRELAEEADRMHAVIETTQLDEAMMSDEDRIAIDDMVQGFRDAAGGKVDYYASRIDESEDRAASYEAEARALKERAAERMERAVAYQREAERDRRLLAYAMRAMQCESLTGSRRKVKLVGVGGKQAIEYVDTLTPEQYPDRFRVQVIDWKRNSDAIREALEKGDAEALSIACLRPKEKRVKVQ